MIYILHRNVNKSKKVFKLLVKTYGLNYKSAELVCLSLGIRFDIRIRQLSKLKKRSLKAVCEKLFCTTKDRRRVREVNISMLLRSGIYKGLRLKQGLPSRGQRTHSNAGTAKRMRGVWSKFLKS